MTSRLPALGSLIVAAVLTLPASPAETQERTFDAELALDVRYPNISAMTEDGRRVAIQLSTRRGRTDTDHHRFGDPTYIAPRYGDLVVVDTRTGDATELGAQVQVREPTWSPDGQRLAYYLRDGDGFELRVWDAGRGTHRPVELGTAKRLSSDGPLAWSPDGEHLLVALRPEGWAAEARAAFLEMTEGPVVVQDSRNDFLAWDRVRNHGRREILARVRVSDGEVEELLPEMPLASVRWGDDGAVLYSVAKPLRTPYGRRDGVEYAVFRIPPDGGDPEEVVAPTEDRIRPAWNEAGTAVAWVDDGDILLRTLDADTARSLTAEYRDVVEEGDTTRLSFSLLAWHPRGESLLVSTRQGWHLLPLDGSAPELILAVEEDAESRPDRDFEHWSGDGDAVYLSWSAPDRWWRGLQRLDPGSGEVEDVVMSPGLYRSWTFADDGQLAVYRYSDGDRPDQLRVVDPRDPDAGEAAGRLLLEPNPGLGEVALARTELVEYLDVDGNTLYGILYYPPDYEAGEPLPLVVEVYEEFFDNGYNENMNLVTAQGWLGFRPSVSFEEGYPGEAWLKAVPTAVNTLIDRGLVDPDRVAVYGQSYGGYAVNLLITQTDRFAAAANISGKVNIISFLGDSPRITTRNYDAAEVGQDRIGATLWEQPHKYVATSAVMFADRIDTPLLLLSGEGDWNVPTTNQREMYYALRRLGKEVVWVNYMNGGHGAGRAASAADFPDHWQRLFDFFREKFEAVDEEDDDEG